MTKSELLTELHAKLRTAIEADYSKLTDEFDDVCAYAICATPLVESIFPVYQRTSEALEDDAAYFPAEWESFGELTFDEEFRAFCIRIHECRNLYNSDEAAGLDADSVFDTMFAVLIELEAEGLFGDRSNGRFLTMWDVGNDEEWVVQSSEKLNSESTHAAARLALLGE